MPIIFPAQNTLCEVFRSSSPFSRPNSKAPIREHPLKSPIFSAWSAVDTVKDKTGQLGNEAARNFEKASSIAQQKAGNIELFSPKYYAACTIGGLLACGTTHTAVTPLDLVKCRRQVDSNLYKGNFEAWGKIGRAEGIRGLFTGWGPTFFGYSVQGAVKYGGYEFFKHFYAGLVGEENAERFKTGLYLTASASAEFFADLGLCPFEAVKVRMQTTIPPTFTGTFQGISVITSKEGISGLYKGLYPLWGRQIPYTMMKFASFETIVAAIYDYLPGQKPDYGKGAQTAVTFTGGYLAGILCAVISHPADVMVSKLNADRAPGESFRGAMSRIYSKIGFTGLWNGLPIRIVLIGSLTSVQWLVYDSFKLFMGLPTTGGGGEVKRASH